MIGKMRRGFTLVELLVVIAIIGLLVALLVPAVNSARELARNTECKNNLKNLATAMIAHEAEKQHFPGRVNFTLSNTGAPLPVSWVTKLQPYMDGANIWDQVLQQGVTLDNWNAVRNGIQNPTTVQGAWFITPLEYATCPSDPQLDQIAARLSYVINGGIWDYDIGLNRQMWLNPGARNDRKANGVGHVIPFDGSSGKVDSAFISKQDGISSTILLSENINAVSWPLLEEGLTAMVWTTQDAWLPETQDLSGNRQYGISKGAERYLDQQLLDLANSNPISLVSLARPSSNHSGSVNVAFCDGHIETLAADVHPWIYARRLSTSKGDARHPQLGANSQIPAQMAPTDASGLAVPTEY
jgi:prepilin-type N-terminal cleavage/methylation domain-containing protein/prepilin-type processing-associated H-X9-DG protein